MHVMENQPAEFEDSRESFVHLVLQLHDMIMSHLIFGVIEYLLTEHLQDVEVIFTNVHVLHRG